MTDLSNIQSNSSVRLTCLGRKIDRATGAIPQTATGAIFNITGGRIVVTSIVGTVTTPIGAVSTLTKLRATPTVGAVNDLSGTVDINAAAAGSLLAPTGLAADALVLSTGGGVSGQRNPIIVAPGSIGVNTAASTTGAIQWTITYVPLDDGAIVTAA